MPDTHPEAEAGQAGASPSPANDRASLPTPATLPVPVASPVEPSARPAQRNPVFAELVQSESDLAGLVGYALYKQNKRDWLASFFKTHGRDPTDNEVESYILGERMPRRLGTYRLLAEDLLDKRTKAAGAAAAPTMATPPTTASRRMAATPGTSLRSSLPADPLAGETKQRGKSSAATLLFWIVVLIVLVLAGYYYVANFSSLAPSR